MHPSHAGHLQHRSLGPYNGALPAFQMGMQNMPPYVPFPNLRPPGISGPVSAMVVQSRENEIPTGKDFNAQYASPGSGNSFSISYVLLFLLPH